MFDDFHEVVSGVRAFEAGDADWWKALGSLSDRYARYYLALQKEALDQALGLLQEIREEIEAERIEVQRNCCVISIYGPHFSERPSIAGLMFDAMADAGIDIHAISTSVSTVSCVIDQDDLEAARARIREAFLLP